MSIYYRIGDLLEQKDINIILQICNSKCTFGAGLALAIKNKYPEVYEADIQAHKEYRNTLGEFSYAATKDGKLIYNLYAMKGLGTNERQLDYEAFYSLLEITRRSADLHDNETENLTIGIPYKIGCDLAGGDWEICKSMINSIFGNSNIKVIICVLPRFRSEINWQNVNIEEDKTYFK